MTASYTITCLNCTTDPFTETDDDQGVLSEAVWIHSGQVHPGLPVRSALRADPDTEVAIEAIREARDQERVREVAPDSPAHLSVADQMRAQIVADNLTTSGATNAHVLQTYEVFHGQAASGIEYYEALTGPNAAAAWAVFQTLDAATQQRVMFNLCRTAAAMMRYLTGRLPNMDAETALGVAEPFGDEEYIPAPVDPSG